EDGEEAPNRWAEPSHPGRIHATNLISDLCLDAAVLWRRESRDVCLNEATDQATMSLGVLRAIQVHYSRVSEEQRVQAGSVAEGVAPSLLFEERDDAICHRRHQRLVDALNEPLLNGQGSGANYPSEGDSDEDERIQSLADQRGSDEPHPQPA